jgi:hypothetical protein
MFKNSADKLHPIAHHFIPDFTGSLFFEADPILS